MFDIASLAVASTAAIHLKSAEGVLLYDKDDKPIRVIVHSPGSRAYAAVETRQNARIVKRMNENEGKLTAASSEERIAETAEDLASITVSFENFSYGDGSLHGEHLYRAVYADPRLGFITKQVTRFLADWSNFKPESGAS